MNLNPAPPVAHVPHVHRLPVETLALIFEIGTHSSGDPNDATLFPMLVSAVSKHFRSVAIHTPNLWTTLRFDSQRPPWYDSNSEDDYEYSYSRDLLWIARSKACPLKLILSYRDEAWNFNENKHYFRREHMEAILALLAPHASRIQRFTLVCDTFAPLHAALRFLAEHGPRMENIRTLELYRCNEFPAEHPVFYPAELADPVPLLGGCHAPNLTHVILSGVHVDWSRSTVPLSDLQALELAFHARDVRPSALAFTQLLDASPRLSSLTVTASGPTGDSRAPPLGGGLPRIHLPLLRTLEIGYQGAADAVALLARLDAPGVAALTVADTSRPAEGDTDGGGAVLAALARARFPRLARLALRAVAARAPALARCLAAHPALHTLALAHVPRALPAALGAAPPPGRALRHLVLEAGAGLDCAGAVARARAAAGVPLAELTLRVAGGVGEEDLALARAHCARVTCVGDESDESDAVLDWGGNDDPYAPGGAFNDPEFDSMFT